MKSALKLLFLLILLLGVFGCVNFLKLSDLRSEDYSYPRDIAKAKTLLGQMGEAHQIDNWENLETYNVTYKDEFYGFLGKQAHPFQEQDMTFSLDYIPKTFDGRMEIVSGIEKGKVWGMQDGQTYKVDASGEVEPKENKDMKFWIPTYQYFIEFPLRIQEATVIDYMGSNVIAGTKVEGVLTSWTTVEPQKKIDQYLIWIDSETKRVVKVEYTVRAAYRFVTGAAFFKDYKDYNGILLPTHMPVESNLLKDGFLHTMRITDFKANKSPAENLRPLDTTLQ